jgi:hypothetical protein
VARSKTGAALEAEVQLVNKQQKKNESETRRVKAEKSGFFIASKTAH